MIDAAYRQCVELTLQYTQVHFQGCGIVFSQGRLHQQRPLPGSDGVFFMIGNLSADHPNLTLPGGTKVKKYFYGKSRAI